MLTMLNNMYRKEIGNFKNCMYNDMEICLYIYQFQTKNIKHEHKQVWPCSIPSVYLYHGAHVLKSYKDWYHLDPCNPDPHMFLKLGRDDVTACFMYERSSVQNQLLFVLINDSCLCCDRAPFTRGGADSHLDLVPIRYSSLPKLHIKCCAISFPVTYG